MSQSFDQFVKVIERLRAPGGCPWDIKQTHQSIKSNLIEECYEVIEAIENEDMPSLKEELGDVLLQVVFHSEVADKNNNFNIEEVIQSITEKMIARHPHVFGDEKCEDSEKVSENWEKRKLRLNPSQKSILEGIPNSLPALQRAQRTQRKVRKNGFNWDSKPKEQILNKIKEEFKEFEAELEKDSPEKIKEEMGDILFSLSLLCEELNIDSEEALRQSTNKFNYRFSKIEQILSEKGKSLTEIDEKSCIQLWNEVKSL